MAQANNYFNISGNLVRDPEVRLTTKQTKYSFVTIAVNGISKDKTDFVTVCFWEKMADNMRQYCHRGDCVTVCGHISTFKNKEGKTETQLTADGFTILRTSKKNVEQEDSGMPEEVITEDKPQTTKVPGYGDVFHDVTANPFSPF